MTDKATKKETPKSSSQKVDDKEKANAARKALHQAVANLPTKPVEKLPIAALKTLPMVMGVGTVLVLFALVSYVPAVERSFFGALDHVSKKTNELMDYTSLSASAGVSSLAQQIYSFRKGEKINSNNINSPRLSYAGRARIKNRHKDEFSTFSESVHLIANSAASIYSLDNIDYKNKNKKTEEKTEKSVTLELIEDKPMAPILVIEEKRGVTIRNLETGEYTCSTEVAGEATTTPGKCKI